MEYILEVSGESFFFSAENSDEAFAVVAKETGILLAKGGKLDAKHFEAAGAEKLTENGTVIFPPSKIVCH